MTAFPDERALDGLAATERLLVCCDFDGTLSHLVDDPAAARPVPGAVDALDRLGTLPRTRSAVLSGRALEALTAVAGMPEHVLLVGSHGAEFDTGVIPGLGARERDLLGRVLAACSAVIADVPGASVEQKPASVAVHVRRADRESGEAVLAAVAAGPATWPGVLTTRGKDVIELAVVEVGKGRALEELRRSTEATAVVFVGDDVTDEDALAVLRAGDLGVKVGSGVSWARWRVPDPDAVVDVLRQLLARRAAAVQHRP